MEDKEDLTDSDNNQTEPPVEENEDSDQNLEESPTMLKSRLHEAYSKQEDLQSKYLRTFADLENLKKRSIRDREEAIQRARLQLIEDLLPVIDAFKMGMIEATKFDPDGPIVNGFNMATNQLQNVLGEYGLVCIEKTGGQFDPNIHEAIGHEESEEEDTVLKIIRIGYRLKDHLIRPASVIISQKRKDQASE
ncbi:nucleotide exchange factor GrpE [Opitutales bacterium]|nr:nucleotide exchange factor GrpE [Opitutales bacterium]